MSVLPVGLLAAPVTHLVGALLDGGVWWWLLVLLDGPLLVAWWWVDPGAGPRPGRWPSAASSATPGSSELERRVEEVAASRAETLDHSAAEVRRIERDLHDGAQARIAVGRHERRPGREAHRDRPGRPPPQLLREARETTVDALEDLRSVVRGIHPPALADRGLAGGIEALALPIPLPVTVTVDAPAAAAAGRVGGVLRGRRVPGQHGQARRRHPRLGARAATTARLLRLVVGDDGRGGADPAGSGLAGVARRLAAFDGTMVVDSPRGRADRRDHGGAVPDQPELRAVLAEDQALLRVGLTRILEASGFDVVGGRRQRAAAERAAGADARRSTSRSSTSGCRRRSPPRGWPPPSPPARPRPGLPVLVLSQHVEPLYARDLLASGEGAVGYLLKDRVADVDEFVAAVRQVAAGGTVLDPEVVAGPGQRRRPARPLDRLTDREREVLTLMAEGRSNAAIAARLFVSEKAVGKHTNAIFTKLDLPQAADDNRRVLAVLAWLQGRRERVAEMTTTPGPRVPRPPELSP